MLINSIIAKNIFEHNKDGHPIFVEESYIIDWSMHLQPHELVMKLNPEQIKEMNPETIAEDSAYWETLATRLQAQPEFGNDTNAQEAYTAQCDRGFVRTS